MDKIDKKYLGDAAIPIIILLVTLAAFIKFENPAVLFAGSLAMTFAVTANIFLSSG
jgi:hypothetical protein